MNCQAGYHQKIAQTTNCVQATAAQYRNIAQTKLQCKLQLLEDLYGVEQTPYPAVLWNPTLGMHKTPALRLSTQALLCQEWIQRNWQNFAG